MKLLNKNYNIDGESSEEEQDENTEDDANESANNGESEEYDDEEGDELEDDEDEPPEMDTNPQPEQTLEARNNKMGLKNPQKGETAKKKSQQPVAKLVIEAIKHLNERSGSSIVAIKRVIISNHPQMDERRLGMQIKRYVKNSLENGTMKQIKRSFKITKKLDQEQKAREKAREKERKKARKEKQMEKSKTKKKNQQQVSKEAVKGDKTKNKSKKSDDKENSNPSKGPTIAKAKSKPTKTTKPNEGLTKGLTEVSGNAKTAKGNTANNKTKARKSINLVIKNTPPGANTKKKSKRASIQQKSSSKTEIAVAEISNSAATANSTSKIRKTRRQ